jgi:hypothetical protein
MTLFTSRDARGWTARELPSRTVEAPPAPTTLRLVGIDVGQINDYSAIAVVDRTWTPPEGEAEYAVVHLERIALGTSYVHQVAHVRRLLATPQLRGARVFLDVTGVGLAVADLFRAIGVEMRGVLIHGGDQVAVDARAVHVPKRDLVSVTQILLQTQRLRIAERLPEAATLIREMQSFEIKISQAGRDSYSAREGQNDDLLLATAIALWAGENLWRLTVDFV